MRAIEVRPWRLVLLFSCVFVLTAYLPHPNLGQSLPQSIGTWLKGTAEAEPDS